VTGVRSHEDLTAWKLAHEVRVRVFAITKRAAFQDHPWLRSQWRRAASAACVNTAEGFSRYWPKDFARFLDIAKASLSEVRELLRDVTDLDLATSQEAAEIRSYARRAEGAMTSLIRYLRTVPPPGKPGGPRL
jgi:four helix bundle protein